jgi:type I restriction enzyme S subunit
MVRDQLESRAKTSAGIWKVSQRDILRTLLPLPGSAEQRELMRRIEECLSLIGSAGKYVEDLAKHTVTLRQSVLSTAFSGQLVPQDPNDEPATILLQRIAKERAARDTAKPRCRSRKKARRAAE